MTTRLSYEDIVLQILAKTSLSKEELESRINDKIQALSGLVSREGAAHIVANELQVSLLEAFSKPQGIGSLQPGMNKLSLQGTVIAVYPLKEFSKKQSDGKERQGALLSFMLKDETGSVRVVLWDTLAKDNANLGQNAHLCITEAKTVVGYQGGVEVHATGRSSLDVTVPEAKAVEQLALEKVTEEYKDMTIQAQGTLVEMNQPYFFEVCPTCNKRMRNKDGGFACDVHGPAVPSYSCVLSGLLDDGTSNIRLVFFLSQAKSFFRIPLLEFKEKRDELMSHLLSFTGSEVRCMGRVSQNSIYNRREIIVQSAQVLSVADLEVQ